MDKERIIKMKESGMSYGEIAEELEIPVSTIKSVIRRARDDNYCLECGAKIVNTPKHRKKKYCNAKCRLNHWKKNKDNLVETRCKYCNKTIYYTKHKPRSFCSRTCYLNYVKGEGYGK